jgi:hypothetical protein
MNTPGLENRSIAEMMSRGIWMMLGPMLLVPFMFNILQHGNGWLTGYDFVFLGTLAVMVLARSFEFYKGHPRTADGAPATQEHLLRYILLVLGGGLAAWIVANVLGNYVIDRFRPGI